ncbi:MAG TPA: heavy metal translocating P-type ATPase [Vicinamibacterales bacterium]|nr:heavy metal translocating P-type ATPase [Vicinamibacterales bacterium]
MSAPAAVAAAPTCARCTRHAESVFRVDGMCCGEEAAILRRRLSPMSGIEDVAADIVGQRLHVKYDAALLSTNVIVDAVAQTGMRAWLEHEEPVAAPGSTTRGVLVAVSAAALGLGLVLQFVGFAEPLAIAAFVTAAVSGGVFPARRATRSLQTRELDINVLMLLAVVGAMFLGEWAEAATVVFLFAIAQWLESRSLDRAREAIRALMDLTPDQARIRHPDHEELVPVEQIAIGAVMLIRPGEKIPLDGAIVNGRSDVNQAPITGESLPVDKGPGDEVFAGTINGHGAIEVAVTRRRRDTTLARIIHLVETAQAQRAPAQQFIDRFARYYTPAVIGLAILIATVPPMVGGAFDDWFYRALVLLVVSCPCALVISTPVSIVSALAGAARRGVLVKGGIHLERLAAVRVVAFDKTGTLTRASVRVTGILPAEGITPEELLAAAAAVESRSEHPIAAAIVAEARRRGLAFDVAANVRALPGLGAEGQVNGEEVLCGNVRLLGERGILNRADAAQADQIASTGASPVIVARNNTIIGILAVADEVRDVAPDTIDLLHRLGIARIVMLTGDQEAAARSVGSRLQIDEVRAGLLPEEKVAAVQDLRRQYGPIAMVGDGVNDAPALAAADVGIAMGVIGSDAALETADVALMTDELPKVAYAIRLSRATVRNIHANVAVSLILKAAFLALAVGGLATLWMAVIADTGTSLIVVANAMRLLRQA